MEGDLIIGTGRSAIGTILERSSRSTILVHLPRMEGWGEKPYVKNGPSLGGYGAIAMNAALTASITNLPAQLRKTLTWDCSKELSGHAQFALETGTKVFFADPHSPWQRPTNENTNGLLRQYFPKGTDLSRWSTEDLEAVAHALNNRPRKILGWKTPAEVCSRSNYAPFHNQVLHRLVEPKVYRSKDYAKLCKTLGVTQSMGAVGSSAHNALAESFNATMKREVLQDAACWPDELTCRREVFRWLVRYNTRRRHTWCGYLSPSTYEPTGPLRCQPPRTHTPCPRSGGRAPSTP